MALLYALLILSLLVTLLLGFDADARRELKEAGAFRDGFKAVTLARAGVQAARAVLRQDALLDAQTGRPYDALTDQWAMPITGRPIGDGVVSASIEDERGKLNLNDLAVPAGNTRSSTILRFKRLFLLVQVDPLLVDAIADWVDPDDIAEPAGAESSYYESLKPPYRASNSALQTLDELHLVKGVTDAALLRLARYITVYPTIPDGLINLNTAHFAVIQVLDPRITSAMASEVILGRPYRSLQDVDRVASLESIAKELRLTGGYAVRSDHFSIRISATVNEVTKDSLAVVRRSGTTGETRLIHFRVE
ncbi:MAG: type II secretion system minor pseudopilin GspK [Nitrospira sp.]|nr:type II secretion system minor pseudopilin GspK [Nitrospira sp.]